MSEEINPYRKWIGAFIPNWLLNKNEVSQGAKLCYGRLCQYAGSNGEAFPRQGEIAKALGVSSRQVRKYLKELEQHQLISIERRGKTQSNMYHFFEHSWMPSDRNNGSGQGGTKVPDTKELKFRSPRNNGSGPYKEENHIREPYKCGDTENWDEGGDQEIDYASFVEQFNEIYDRQLRVTDKKREMIRGRLRTFTGAEIEQAWKNRKEDEWLNGKGREYLVDWKPAMRNDEKVERYLEPRQESSTGNFRTDEEHY